MCRESTYNAGDRGDKSSVPGSGRSPVVGNGNSLQYSCLDNLMDSGAWWADIGAWKAIIHGVEKS